MSSEALVSKPESGHWTDAYPGLGRGPVSLEDCVSEEFYEREREHVFKKTWLYMGRVEQVPRSGCYFTRELTFLNTSIIVVRGKDGVIRAMHNICPHRGNKMLWEDDPFQEVSGRAPLLYCRFHGWRYHLDGSLHSATRQDLLLDFDADSCRVPAIQCEVWEGFVFVNLDPHNTEPLRSFLGELAHGIEGYPFEGPHQVYRFKAELQCNWKIFVDGFAESYHGPYLHASSFGSVTAEAREALNKPNPFTDALAYRLADPHRMYSFSGEPSRRTPYSKPIECVMEASAAGPWTKRAERGPLPPGMNPTRSEKYGFDSFQFFPNFVLIFGASGFTVHTHWPTGPHSHIFETEMYYQPPRTHKERLGQELTVTYLNDIILEDASPSEGLQAMLNSGALTHFTMNDEEILLRHLHKMVGDYVEAGESAKGNSR
ncbi:aromatic ring-hydroxylating oxygenase subunit alpha [Mycolicibacterium arseniciresistens]|uniref:Aromatic ring-hydroxylating dioxygenase subunit alpha n=1 Tax=Mycolicibacterium arseniciresistens TaxID=3062257 RepID=A0ABT8UAQ0_9MYCO|nr:aromatic ring-hydroxylating dioxygenase subunit alpha [Mycolicibacterium arseniciresistens]MDO3634866.1 aromatic ring-hydroxylating dioxygenase subunit alpha [Mycolicibacterium arseniciresistens]